MYKNCFVVQLYLLAVILVNTAEFKYPPINWSVSPTQQRNASQPNETEPHGTKIYASKKQYEPKA